jgi:hypothetical protein
MNANPGFQHYLRFLPEAGGSLIALADEIEETRRAIVGLQETLGKLESRAITEALQDWSQDEIRTAHDRSDGTKRYPLEQ